MEDKATSDTTTAITVDASLRASATILAKQDCVVAGLGCIDQILGIYSKLTGKTNRYEVISHPEMFDGVRVKRGQAIAVIRHNARVILSCERVILNLMQRMSGIATLTREYVDAVKKSNVNILDTRKTVPGMRVLDKYAVRCGGGQNHRLDLSDGILIKNNHISLGGGVAAVLARARSSLLGQALKHARQELVTDALTVVAHRDLNLCVGRGETHVDGSSCRSEFHGIGQDVPEDLLEPRRVAVDTRDVTR